MPDTYICVKCGKVAKTRQALERHAAYHEDDRPFSCEVCLQRFKNSDDRGKHYRRLRRDGKFNTACTVCHKHFRTDEMLIKHVEMLGCKKMSEVTVKQELADNEAGINIGNDSGAVTLKEENKPGDGVNCTCKICELEFKNTSCLKAHYKHMHSDTKKQVCIQCGQTLSSKDSLARHFSIFHQTSFPYSCDMCNQKFKIKESLCRHVKFVHQDGGYTCPECQRVFSQPVNLKKHMAVHSSQKEYACKICGREFRWKQALQKHESLHDLPDDDIDNSNKSNDDTDMVNKPESTMLLENAESDTTENYDDDDVTAKGIGNTLMDEMLEKHDMDKRLNNMGQTFNTTLHEDCNSLNKSNCAKINTSSNTKGSNVDIRHEQLDEVTSSDTMYNEFEKVDDEVADRESSNSGQEKSFVEQVLERKRAGDPLHVHCNHGHNKKKIKLANEKLLGNDNGPSSVRPPELNAENITKFPTLLLLNEIRGEMLDTKNTNDNEESPSLEKSTVDMQMEDNENIFTQYQMDKKYDDIKHIDCYGSRRHSDESSEHFDNDIACQKLRYSSLTSFPTMKTQNAPKCVFKPSSIQNILTGPAVSSSHVAVATEQEKTQYAPKFVFKPSSIQNILTGPAVSSSHVAVATEQEKTQYAPKFVFKPSSIQNILTGPAVSSSHVAVATEQEKTQYAPKLVFKPSSIQNILTGPAVSSSHVAVATEQEKKIDNIHCNRRTHFKFPSTNEPLYKRLHNPFIMHSSSASSVPAVTNENDFKSINSTNLFGVQKDKIPSKPSSTPSDHVVPAGKFSLLKHMLSLQNEENFDKTIFENPLYHKPADVKDFELMVERHRVTDKSDDSTIDTYDLSAKQNIPFNWLGMSVAKKNLPKTADENKKDMFESEKSVDIVSVEINENCEGNGKLFGTQMAEKYSFTGVQYKSANDYNSEVVKHFDNTHQQTTQKNQASKRMIATASGNLRNNDNQSQIGAQDENFIRENPLDYQDMDFQEKSSAVKAIISCDNTCEQFGRSHTKIQSYKLVTQEETLDEHRHHLYNLSKVVDTDTVQSMRQCESLDSYSTLNVNGSEHVQPSVMSSSPPNYINSHTVPRHVLGLSNTSSSVASSDQLTRTFAVSSVDDAPRSQDVLSFPESLSESLSAPDPVTTSSRYLSRSFSIPSSCSYSKVTAQRLQPRWGSSSAIRMENDAEHPLNVTKHRYKTNDSLEPISSENDVISSNQYVNMDKTSEQIYVERRNEKQNIPARHFDLMMINKNIAQLQRLRDGRLGRIDRTNCTDNMRKCAATVEKTQDTNNTKSYLTENMTPSIRLINQIDNREYGSVSTPPSRFCTTVINGDVQLYEESKFDAYTLIDSPDNSKPATVAVRRATSMPEARTKRIGVFDQSLKSREGNICQFSQNECILSEFAGENKVHRMGVLENTHTSTMGRQAPHCIVMEDTASQQLEQKRTEVSIFDILKSSGSDDGKDFESIDCLLDTYIS